MGKELIPHTQRLLLRVGERVIGVIDHRVLRKRVRASRHFLRKPVPSIALDAHAFDTYRAQFDTIEVLDTETGTRYRLPAREFEKHRFSVEYGAYGKQYAVPLRYWLQEPAEPCRQGQLALEMEG